MSGKPLSVTRATVTLIRLSGFGQSNGDPFGETIISAPVSASVSTTSGVQISSQIATPRRTPRTFNGPGIGPAANTRFSSKTP